MAIRYIHTKHAYLLSTNYKVWFSTLNHQKELERARQPEFTDILSGPPMPHYLLVRNPYRRVESFYKDKIIRQPQRANKSQKFKWQHCQRKFFPYLGLTGREGIETIKDRFAKVTFYEFLDILPEVALKEEHLIPQHTARYHHQDGKQTTLTFDQIVHTDRQDGLDFIRSNLGLNTRIRHNSTEEITCETEWNLEGIRTVNQLYAEDFNFCGYPVV